MSRVLLLVGNPLAKSFFLYKFDIFSVCFSPVFVAVAFEVFVVSPHVLPWAPKLQGNCRSLGKSEKGKRGKRAKRIDSY